MSQSSKPAGKYLKVCCCVKSHSQRECMTERTKRARTGFLKHCCWLRSANFHSCQTAPKKAGLTCVHRPEPTLLLGPFHCRCPSLLSTSSVSTGTGRSQSCVFAQAGRFKPRSLTLPIVFQCTFQRSQWNYKFSGGGLGQTQHQEWTEMLPQLNKVCAILTTNDNPADQSSYSFPQLVKQHRGVSALFLRALCVLQQGSAEGHRDRKDTEEQVQPNCTVFPTAVDFYYKRAVPLC